MCGRRFIQGLCLSVQSNRQFPCLAPAVGTSSHGVANAGDIAARSREQTRRFKPQGMRGGYESYLCHLLVSAARLGPGVGRRAGLGARPCPRNVRAETDQLSEHERGELRSHTVMSVVRHPPIPPPALLWTYHGRAILFPRDSVNQLSRAVPFPRLTLAWDSQTNWVSPSKFFGGCLGKSLGTR